MIVRSMVIPKWGLWIANYVAMRMRAFVLLICFSLVFPPTLGRADSFAKKSDEVSFQRSTLPKLRSYLDQFYDPLAQWNSLTDVWVNSDISDEVNYKNENEVDLLWFLPRSDNGNILNEVQGRYNLILRRLAVGHSLEALSRWAAVLPSGSSLLEQTPSFQWGTKHWVGFNQKYIALKNHIDTLDKNALRKTLSEGLVEAALLLHVYQQKIDQIQGEIFLHQQNIEKTGSGFVKGVIHWFKTIPRDTVAQINKFTKKKVPQFWSYSDQEIYVAREVKEIKRLSGHVEYLRSDMSQVLGSDPTMMILTHGYKVGNSPVELPAFELLYDAYETSRIQNPLTALDHARREALSLIDREGPEAAAIIRSFSEEAVFAQPDFFAPLTNIRLEAMAFIKELATPDNLSRFVRADHWFAEQYGFDTGSFESMSGQELATVLGLSVTTTGLSTSAIISAIGGAGAEEAMSAYVAEGRTMAKNLVATNWVARGNSVVQAVRNVDLLVAGRMITAARTIPVEFARKGAGLGAVGIYIGAELIQKKGYQNFVKGLMAQSTYVGTTSYEASFMAQNLSMGHLATTAFFELAWALFAGQRALEGSKILNALRGQTVKTVLGTEIAVTTGKGAMYYRELGGVIEAGRAKAVLELVKPNLKHLVSLPAWGLNFLYVGGSIYTLVNAELDSRGYVDFWEAWSKSDAFQRDFLMTLFCDGVLAFYGGGQNTSFWHFATIVGAVSATSSYLAQIKVGGPISFERILFDGGLPMLVSTTKFRYGYIPMVRTTKSWVIDKIPFGKVMSDSLASQMVSTLDFASEFYFSVKSNSYGNELYVDAVRAYQEGRPDARAKMDLVMEKAAQEASRRRH